MRANRVVGEPKLARQLLNRGYATAQERHHLPLGASEEPLIPASRHDSDAPCCPQPTAMDHIVNIVKYNIDKMEKSEYAGSTLARCGGPDQEAGGGCRKEDPMKSRGTQWFVTAVATAGLFIAGGVGSAAQDATPAGGSAHAHPAHIHLGTCSELDPNPAFPLTDVAPASNESGAEADSAAAIPVERSVTMVDATLEDLRTGGYAINIHQSVEEIGTYIACGNLSGSIDESGALVVGLRRAE